MHKKFNSEALIGAYWLIRVQAPVTKLLGPKYTRSRSSIEIDITYRCNLSCCNCNRSCSQAPSVEQMTVQQIQMFIKDSVDNGIRWKNIRLLGGEPTLHPDILIILQLLQEYIEQFSPDTSIHLVTNGFGKKVADILSKVPQTVKIENSAKESSEQFFHPFNVAPNDRIEFKFADYSNGCEQTAKWGIGLTPYGYYPCALAGGIDRIFGFDLGRKKLPNLKDSMVDQLQVFCKLCGMFRYANHTWRGKMSHTWEKAYAEYKKKKPRLSSY